MNHQSDSHQPSIDEFRSYLYLLARAHLNPRLEASIDASDLVQQTLLDAHARRGQFRGHTDAEFAVWLRKILTTNLHDAWRHLHRAKRDIRRQRSLDVEIDGSFRRAESWLLASQSSPSQNAAKKEDLVRLANGLAHLNEAQREAVILRHLQRLSLAEIAERLGRSEKAVAGLVYRGLNNLQRSLVGEEER